MTSTSSPIIFDALEAQMRGRLIRPGDDDYDAARTVYNAMIDRRPLAIARCADVADVMATVSFSISMATSAFPTTGISATRSTHGRCPTSVSPLPSSALPTHPIARLAAT